MRDKRKSKEMGLLTKSVWIAGVGIFATEETKNVANTGCLGEAFVICDGQRHIRTPNKDFVNSPEISAISSLRRRTVCWRRQGVIYSRI